VRAAARKGFVGHAAGAILDQPRRVYAVWCMPYAVTQFAPFSIFISNFALLVLQCIDLVPAYKLARLMVPPTTQTVAYAPHTLGHATMTRAV
jgi:hypothetical protein